MPNSNENKNICRTCLDESNKSMISIYEETTIQNKIQLVTMLKECTTVTVSK